MKKFFKKFVALTLIFVLIGAPLFASAFSTQWGLTAINSANLQASVASNLQNITVAVIDTGLDVSNPAFAGKIVSPYNFTSEGASNDITDTNGHGTIVAGIIAANAGQVGGVAKGVKIMPLKVISPAGSTIANLAKAITYAADNSANIINISLELASSTITPDLTSAVNYAESKGCTLVSSVGNDSSTNSIAAPACMNGVIAVGSAGYDGNVFYAAKTSNRNSSKQILYAPGIDILSTYSKDAPSITGETTGSSGEKYASMNGTSMAAAFVSGAAALYKAEGVTNVSATLFTSAKTQDMYIQGFNGPIAMQGQTMSILSCASASAPTQAPAPKTASVATTESILNNDFADTQGYWAETAIDSLAAQGIVVGISANTFSPEDNITRADYILMVTRMMGISTSFSSNFADVSPGKYYYNAIGMAKQLGLVQGDQYNLFNPEASITREDMFTIMYNILQIKGKIAAKNSSILDNYSDVGNIDSYAKTAMESLASAGLITGVDNTVCPQNNATRAETSMFLYRVEGLLGK